MDFEIGTVGCEQIRPKSVEIRPKFIKIRRISTGFIAKPTD